MDAEDTKDINLMRLAKEIIIYIKNKFRIFKNLFFTSRGLIVVLLSGIFVSIISSRLEDTVRRQRYLELLQLEIRNHVINSNILSQMYKDNNGDLYSKQYIPDQFYRAVVNSGYLTSVDPDVFLKIVVYYNLVNDSNDSLRRSYLNLDKIYTDIEICEYEATNSAEMVSCAEQKDIFDKAQKSISSQQISVWGNLQKFIYDKELNKFNPTQERKNSLILRLLMGSEALPMQE
ncbi:TPA: hypothetical protein DIV55_02415 [Patescibacteria group bacterium]|uniref:Uncharacterized protein n=1 Tax=Candidatus Gottesmanbacteria bacterium GW2011_GWA1_43_11 TaxID=1618436 RepID=A0A0G1CDZ2_9BACT|nr:MAG: hypothetical protein UV59_C0032G0010 [Candidatus Gottesmanbacteria bacterium GW2011_GWA1_43_11]HCS78573.1 hypothetical protein [Patescibacteria group bacterium]